MFEVLVVEVAAVELFIKVVVALTGGAGVPASDLTLLSSAAAALGTLIGVVLVVSAMPSASAARSEVCAIEVSAVSMLGLAVPSSATGSRAVAVEAEGAGRSLSFGVSDREVSGAAIVLWLDFWIIADVILKADAVTLYGWVVADLLSLLCWFPIWKRGGCEDIACTVACDVLDVYRWSK